MTLAIQPSLAYARLYSEFVELFESERRDVPATNRLENRSVAIVEGRVIQRSQRSWMRAKAFLSDIQSDGTLAIEFSPTRPTLVMIVEEVGGVLDIRRTTAPRKDKRGHARLDAVSLLPAGFHATANSASMQYCRLFTLEIDDTILRGHNHVTDSRDGTDVARLMLVEPRVVKICQLLAQECVSNDADGTGYADSLVDALVLVLSRLGDEQQKTASRGGLAPWQLRLVQEHMLENLTARVCTQQLAEIAQLSVTHFHRAFKASVGCAPHQWLIGARIEEAKRRLMSDRASIADISLSLGFCDQAHLTRRFTKWVGMTPLAWQKSFT